MLINLPLDKDLNVNFEVFWVDLECPTAAEDLRHIHIWVGNDKYSSTIHLLHFLKEGFDISLVAFTCFVKSIDEKESVFELPVEVHEEFYEFASVRLCLVYLVHKKRF